MKPCLSLLSTAVALVPHLCCCVVGIGFLPLHLRMTLCRILCCWDDAYKHDRRSLRESYASFCLPRNLRVAVQCSVACTAPTGARHWSHTGHGPAAAHAHWGRRCIGMGGVGGHRQHAAAHTLSNLESSAGCRPCTHWHCNSAKAMDPCALRVASAFLGTFLVWLSQIIMCQEGVPEAKVQGGGHTCTLATQSAGGLICISCTVCAVLYVCTV